MRDVVKECNEVIGQQQKLITTLEATVWTVNPELADSFASRVYRDIPTAFNEIPR